MKGIMLIVAINVCILFLPGCSEDDSSVNPPGENDLLINSTFEKNGQPTDDGWKISPESLGEIVEDAPPGGGDYSLSLSASNPEGGKATYTVEAMENKSVYRFSLWAKTDTSSSVIYFDQIRNGQVESRKELNVTGTSWKELSLTDTLQIAAGDSLRITFRERLSQIILLRTFYDLCKLEAVD